MNIIRYICKPIVLLHLILLIQWGIFLGTTLQPYTVHVPDRTYNLLRGHLIYTSLIREGRDGAWKTTITHTTRKSPAVYAHMFFISLGKLAALFHIDPPIMYMAARMAAAVILFWSTYWFVVTILPASIHSLALFFILALEPGPMLSSLNESLSVLKPSIFSYYPQIVTYRHFGLPHHTLGEAIGLLTITLQWITLQKPTRARYIWLCILSFIGTTILPPYFIIISVCILLPWMVWHSAHKAKLTTYIPIILSAGSIAAVSLFLKHQFSLGTPWLDFNQDEKHWVSNSDVLISYVSTLLLYIPCILALWMWLLTHWKKISAALQLCIILMTTWTIVPALLVPVSHPRWFPLANFRLMDGYNYVPAGVLAALCIYFTLFSIKKSTITRWVTRGIILSLICTSGYLTYAYTKLVMEEQSIPWTNVYIANDHFKAFKFLETVPTMSGIMISNHFGEIAPEYAPVRSFIGSTPGYYDWPERAWIVGKFYGMGFTPEEVRTVVTREDISYVYYGDAEKTLNPTGAPLYPDLLLPVFETPTVTIYKVKK